jgi:hypothetical protein
MPTSRKHPSRLLLVLLLLTLKRSLEKMISSENKKSQKNKTCAVFSLCVSPEKKKKKSIAPSTSFTKAPPTMIIGDWLLAWPLTTSIHPPINSTHPTNHVHRFLKGLCRTIIGSAHSMGLEVVSDREEDEPAGGDTIIEDKKEAVA